MNIRLFVLIGVFTLLLTGCLYPKDPSTKFPDETEVKRVQDAVIAFQKENDGILPIKTKDADTDLYIKYLIDFRRIVPQYLSEIPKNAYENGGIFQYVIIDAETDPKVKIFDLHIVEKIREIQLRLSTKKYPPYKEQLAADVFTLDFSKLGYHEDPFIVSPFTGQQLPFVINGRGDLFLDYTGDLLVRLKEMDQTDFKENEDIRWILTEGSIFVPAYSLPYTVNEEGEPIFFEKKFEN
ncbi:hypothetical protein [Fervidibacillus halotolerans]|uniref:Lipoprotein n=1 Tax=Fervidibacillus halotolerans TaxID=2980027 RepID=A0A9E8M1E8_9BACI|nr:hypothetical protein [Fervidibacillus halotolerans]WAA13768.1 hypothetical protein OE105_06615 [Fervidibacillus halotolerans]